MGEEVFNNGRGWSSDWTIVKAFSLNASSYLFISKENTGDYQVRQIYRGIKSNGDEFVNFGDNPIHEGNIQGYSIVEFFSISDRNFIFRMNKSNGSVIIQLIGDVASLGDIVYDEKVDGEADGQLSDSLNLIMRSES
ncbi:MAG: hypothetical protein IPG99_15150 [Ignavibacteria bacterium]|nr:hypothetical protein [Ignavibacteria bacterium]